MTILRRGLLSLFLLTIVVIYSINSDAQEFRIALEEGEFIIKGLTIVQERYGSPKLKGSVLNNTQKDWKSVSFKTYFYDRTGNKLKVGILKEETFAFKIHEIKRGEEKQIGLEKIWGQA